MASLLHSRLWAWRWTEWVHCTTMSLLHHSLTKWVPNRRAYGSNKVSSQSIAWIKGLLHRCNEPLIKRVRSQSWACFIIVSNELRCRPYGRMVRIYGVHDESWAFFIVVHELRVDMALYKMGSNIKPNQEHVSLCMRVLTWALSPWHGSNKKSSRSMMSSLHSIVHELHELCRRANGAVALIKWIHNQSWACLIALFMSLRHHFLEAC